MFLITDTTTQNKYVGNVLSIDLIWSLNQKVYGVNQYRQKKLENQNIPKD